MAVQVIFNESGEFEFSLADGTGVRGVTGVESLVYEFHVADETMGEVEASRADLAKVAVGELLRRQQSAVVVFVDVGARHIARAFPPSFFNGFFDDGSAVSGAVFDDDRRRLFGDAFFLVDGVDVCLNRIVGLGQHLLAEEAFDERLLRLVAEALFSGATLDESTPLRLLGHLVRACKDPKR